MSERNPEVSSTTRQDLGLPELIAIGVGGMIGGGIFSVLGIAVGISGHAAPLAFALGGIIALLTSYSYICLALALRNDGASFTYLERAFPSQPWIGGILGWVVVVGYVGTLALYAFTFGAYGADLLGSPGSARVRVVLSLSVLGFFMVVNLLGARSSGRVEDLIVYTKILLLALFGVAGMTTVRRDHLTPVFDHGVGSVFVAGAMIFVAFEGFQLITNGVCETRDPDRNIPRGIYGSVLITTLIYLVIAVVAVGNLGYDEIVASGEYALAAAAEPTLGNAGRVLVGVAALMATASAINATSFGASRMMDEMGRERVMLRVFSVRSKGADVPVVAVCTLGGAGALFTAFDSLDTIAAFSSLTFLVVSLGVAVANLKLRRLTKARPVVVVVGMGVGVVTIALLLGHLWDNERAMLARIGAIYAGVIALALVSLWFRRRGGGGARPVAGDPEM